ncbi:hypothetical protein KBD75_01960 [Candidatus Woesebacteria bacterium]|nr:hypothetical protein [Candidatus Woesebacteria bacterium]
MVGQEYNKHAQNFRGDDFVKYLASIVSDPKLLADLSAMHEYQLTLESKLREIVGNQS